VKEQHADLGKASSLQPIFWDGEKQIADVPHDIADIQLTHEDYGEEYNYSGLLKLIRTNREKYWHAVYAIADRICDAAKNAPLPELPQAPDWDRTRPLFPVAAKAKPKPGFASSKPTKLPRQARFVWVVGKREEVTQRRSLDCYDPHGSAQDWLPFLPDTNDPGRLIAGDAAREVKLDYVGGEDVPQDQEELKRLIDDAAKAHTPIVIITDLWSLHIDRYGALISMFDEGKKDNCAVIFPWNFKDPETSEQRQMLRQRLAEILPLQFHKVEPSLLFEGIVDANTFRAELSKLLTKYMADIGRTLEAVRRLPDASAFKAPPQLGPTSATP
jgi:FxsC-like protein